jgi:hypothetical protein
MSDHLFSQFYGGRGPRGPYGSNIGDTWYASDELNRMIREDKGPEWAILIYVKADDNGMPVESVFSTKNSELIEEARQGTIKWAQAHARLN